MMISSPSIATIGFGLEFSRDCMNNPISLALGLLIWFSVIWDGFATMVLPRTAVPMKRLSGRFYNLSWQFWSLIARGIRTDERRLTFLAIFGPLSVMLLLIIWAGLAVVAFALIYHGSGSRFLEKGSPVGFGTLLYMSGSTFLTLGLGDVTSTDSLGRMFMVLEAATGFVFLGLIITYMPLLDQAYASREVGGLLLQSRAGKPPSAVRLLRRYAGADRAEILRGNLREGEHWMAATLQSHLSHPVLCFYRAQHYGQSWLVSLTTVLDTSSLLIVGGEGLVREQARLTYRMGLLLLADLASALELKVSTSVDSRLTEADLPALRAALSSEGVALRLGPAEGTELVRINHRYDVYLHAMARWLMVTLPPWIPPADDASTDAGLENTQGWNAIDPGMTDRDE
jgi:hypothetical protein